MNYQSPWITMVVSHPDRICMPQFSLGGTGGSKGAMSIGQLFQVPWAARGLLKFERFGWQADRMQESWCLCVEGWCEGIMKVLRGLSDALQALYPHGMSWGYLQWGSRVSVGISRTGMQLMCHRDRRMKLAWVFVSWNWGSMPSDNAHLKLTLTHIRSVIFSNDLDVLSNKFTEAHKNEGIKE